MMYFPWRSGSSLGGRCLSWALGAVTAFWGVYGCKERERADGAQPSATAIVASSARPAKRLTFEGEAELHVQVSGQDEVAHVQMWMKNDQVRLDIGPPEGKVQERRVIDTAKQRAALYRPADKKFETVDYRRQLEALGPWLPTAAGGEVVPDVKRTTLMSKTAAQTCRIWEYTYPSGETGTVCLAPLGSHWYRESVGEVLPWMTRVIGTTSFPVLYQNVDKAGQETARWRVVRFERKSVEDEVFETD